MQTVSDRFLFPIADIAGLQPLIVPSIPSVSDARQLAKAFDILVLTGSFSDISPARYGSPHAPRGHEDHGRDAMALALAAEMIEAGKPIFGICRGLQEINVLFGGTLHRDLGDVSEMHFPSNADYIEALASHRHDVHIEGPILGQPRSANVVSVHHQGIDRLGTGLSIEAKAPDGLIEAISTNVDAPVLAVQWHPEWDAQNNPESRTFYTLLGQAARHEPLAA